MGLEMGWARFHVAVELSQNRNKGGDPGQLYFYHLY